MEVGSVYTHHYALQYSDREAEMTESTSSTQKAAGSLVNNDDARSHQSQTASDYIDSQLQLEADAREALPYNFDHCTQPLGALRQSLFACLTCNPPPDEPTKNFTPAAVCYSCSIACHGEHTLVELFNRRNFTCDCGTTRLPSTSPCTLRIHPETGTKAPVHSQTPAPGNSYNQNFRNRFCGCGELYDPHKEKGTMFQCLGLASEADGGCGEDWWHPECIMGLERKTQEKGAETAENGVENDEHRSLPAGFPDEDAFETFICYKCVHAHPWIKAYAGTSGFLPAIPRRGVADKQKAAVMSEQIDGSATETKSENDSIDNTIAPSSPRKRSAGDANLEDPAVTKKPKAGEVPAPAQAPADSAYHASLPSPPEGDISLFLREDFRDHFCRCRQCYPVLSKHPQLLEEEDTYEPPLSESGEGEGSVGSKSLLERGEAALSNVDRVRAIEGGMGYHHLKDTVKAFLQPFAESGQAVGAEDIKAYFEKLRGDEQGIQEAGAVGASSGDNRKEQSGTWTSERA